MEYDSSNRCAFTSEIAQDDYIKLEPEIVTVDGDIEMNESVPRAMTVDRTTGSSSNDRMMGPFHMTG